MKNYILEVCVDSIESAEQAKIGGADRLELCANLVIGGTTPSFSLFKRIKEIISLPIHVLIRPRYGDFCYSDRELLIMTDDIQRFKDEGANGVVIGALRPDGSLDISVMEKLCRVAGAMSITLHRAFDMCKDPYETLKHATDLGVNVILTSGQKNHCIEGIKLIKELTESNQIDIMVGSGVNADVIRQIRATTKVTSFHLSGKKKVDSTMIYRNQDVSMGIASLSEYENWITCADIIKEAKKALSV